MFFKHSSREATKLSLVSTSNVLSIIDFVCISANITGLLLGCLGGFDDKTASKLSYDRALLQLELLAKKKGITVKKLLDGRTLDQFLKQYHDRLEALENDARKVVLRLARADNIEVTPDNKHIIDMMGGINFLSLAKVGVEYDDIKEGLLDRRLCVIPDASNTPRFMMDIGDELLVHYCIGGGTVRHGYEPEESERKVRLDPSYVIEFASLAVTEDDFLLVDMDAQRNPDAEKFGTRFKMIPLPGTSRFVRLAKVGVAVATKKRGLTTYFCSLRDNRGDQKYFMLHRLQHIISDDNGFGLRNSMHVRRYLELEDCQSFEDVKRFQWRGGDVTHPSVIRRLAHG